jgi:hypothetical protein
MTIQETLTIKSPINLNNDDWENLFKEKAKQLFSRWDIMSNGKRYAIIEIEFYYDSRINKHPDHFIYKDERKSNMQLGTWFFHYSGIDITFGNEAKEERGGILIRGVRDLSTKKDFLGPLRSMIELLNGFTSVDSEDGIRIRLVESEVKREVDIVSGVRRGLDKSKRKDYKDEANRKYRFINNTFHKESADSKQASRHYAEFKL